jgi:hypothetical protein
VVVFGVMVMHHRVVEIVGRREAKVMRRGFNGFGVAFDFDFRVLWFVGKVFVAFAIH